MKKMVPWLTTMIASYVGWWAGARVGFMTAFIVSIIAGAVGLYVGKRWVAENLSPATLARLL